MNWYSEVQLWREACRGKIIQGYAGRSDKKINSLSNRQLHPGWSTTFFHFIWLFHLIIGSPTQTSFKIKGIPSNFQLSISRIDRKKHIFFLLIRFSSPTVCDKTNLIAFECYQFWMIISFVWRENSISQKSLKHC